MSDDAQEWRWVGEDGVEKAVTEQELIAELSSEALPSYTLVWKKRWLEWLPAMQVAELGWALPPGRADRTVKARENAGGVSPPPPPLYRYPVIKRRAATLRGVAAASPLEPPTVVIDARGGPISRPVEEEDMDAIEASSPVASAEGSVPTVRRPSDDDVTVVADADFVSDRATPFSGMEPTRALFGAHSYAEDDDGDTHVLPSRPPPAGPVYVPPHMPPPSEAPGPTYDENEIPHIPRPPGSPTDLSAYARLTPSQEPELQTTAPPPPKRPYAAAGGAAVIGIVAALLVAHGIGDSKHEDADDAAAASASAAAKSKPTTPSAQAPRPALEEIPKGPPCTTVTAATKVADWAEPGVSPTVAAIRGSARLAVGFGQTDTYAIGITIDPRTLDRDQVFREFRKEKLVSVVPTTASGKLHFEMVREGHPLANARAVDAASPFTLGATPFSIARLGKKDEPDPLWSLAEADQSTVPRVVPVPGGYAVAIRRGNKNGPVAVGFLDANGAKRTELTDVRAEGGFAGAPSLAASDDTLLVAFASRGSATVPWGIVAGASRLDEAPRKSLRIKLRDGGPGGDRMSPAVGALGGGRWLLQWTEGSAGNRMVRAQVLGSELAPATEAVNVSPVGANAGQGVVWTSGDLATVLFFVKNDKSNNELWGVSLECPR